MVKENTTQRQGRRQNSWWRSFKRNWEYKIAIFIIAYYLISHVVLETTDRVKERGLNKRLRVLPEVVINYYGTSREFDDKAFNVNKFAYMQYATNYDYLNLAILNFIHLRKGNTQIPNLVILYDEILQFYSSDNWSMLVQLANQYKIELRPVGLLKANYGDDTTWAASFTKFHIFNQVEYERILYFDSDSMFVKIPEVRDINFETLDSGYGNVDELFKLPRDISFALTQAYWINDVVEGRSQLKTRIKVEIPEERRYSLRMRKIVYDLRTCENPSEEFELLPELLYEDHKFNNVDNFFANHFMIITPSKKTFNRLMKYVSNPWYWSFTNRANLKKKTDYDMEILNKFLDNELRSNNNKLKIGILPHRVYGVLTGEFGEEWHERFVVEPQYLPFIKKRSNKGWDAMKFFRKIKVVHFSDSPIPKPWEDQDNTWPYNNNKIYCKYGDMEKYNQEYPTEFKPRLIEDCDSVEIWNWFRNQFYKAREGMWFV
ncbi:GNT1 [[Candida] subhashii]|uniref:GNT1 n=1 Tax=[Candida] subhashii TaxID=561895 RepID=A0A8J5V1F3_9ASCO|nr:GNT1 [[Candida] subhashii]KAG7665900.1 GNT1 [[Candida] subhashii]